MRLSKVSFEIQDGRHLDPMGQYLAMGTSEFLNNIHQRSLKCRLKNTLGVHGNPLFLLDYFNDCCLTWSDPHTNSELGNQLLNLCISHNLHQLHPPKAITFLTLS